ncbi:MAG: hypothetical protein Ct9H300mP1_27490 [Planctomycetaceae bacterium]|nr:MAG: hypothetical protein Ct9H300mP1_27490 [Planctomycetaceae bacterium]
MAWSGNMLAAIAAVPSCPASGGLGGTTITELIQQRYGSVVSVCVSLLWISSSPVLGRDDDDLCDDRHRGPL